MIAGYLAIKEIAERWGVTRRRVQALCSQGKIEGATRFRHEWAIPDDTEWLIDKHVMTGEYKIWRKKEKDKEE